LRNKAVNVKQHVSGDIRFKAAAFRRFARRLWSIGLACGKAEFDPAARPSLIGAGACCAFGVGKMAQNESGRLIATEGP
jgi:hypothetical protein